MPAREVCPPAKCAHVYGESTHEGEWRGTGVVWVCNVESRCCEINMRRCVVTARLLVVARVYQRVCACRGVCVSMDVCLMCVPVRAGACM